MGLQLTTIERIKRAGLTDIDLNDSTYDQVLTSLIAEVSSQFEQYLGHPLISGTVTEVRDVESFTSRMWLDVAPVSSITSIKNRSSFSTAFSSLTAISSTSYDFNPTTGRVDFSITLVSGSRALEIIYVGGFAATTSAMLTSYPDIVGAGERQIAESFRRRMNPDEASESLNGITSTTQQPLRLLPSIKDTLRRYKRFGVV